MRLASSSAQSMASRRTRESKVRASVCGAEVLEEVWEAEGADGRWKSCLPLPFSVPFPFPLSEPLPLPLPLSDAYGAVLIRLEGFHSTALALGQLRSSKEREVLCCGGRMRDVEVTDCDILDFGGVGVVRSTTTGVGIDFGGGGAGAIAFPVSTSLRLVVDAVDRGVSTVPLSLPTDAA